MRVATTYTHSQQWMSGDTKRFCAYRHPSSLDSSTVRNGKLVIQKNKNQPFPNPSTGKKVGVNYCVVSSPLGGHNKAIIAGSRLLLLSRLLSSALLTDLQRQFRAGGCTTRLIPRSMFLRSTAGECSLAGPARRVNSARTRLSSLTRARTIPSARWMKQ